LNRVETSIESLHIQRPDLIGHERAESMKSPANAALSNRPRLKPWTGAGVANDEPRETEPFRKRQNR
jgi:hypothetical protein